MVKTIKKIDLQGNKVWQEVIVCNRCKKVLESEDIAYTTKWNSACPVGPFQGAYCFSAGSNPNRHFCEKCSKEIENFWEGKDLEEKENHKSMLTTFEERVASHKESLQCESTPVLEAFLNSCMCSVETMTAIDLILKDRHYKK